MVLYIEAMAQRLVDDGYPLAQIIVDTARTLRPHLPAHIESADPGETALEPGTHFPSSSELNRLLAFKPPVSVESLGLSRHARSALVRNLLGAIRDAFDIANSPTGFEGFIQLGPKTQRDVLEQVAMLDADRRWAMEAMYTPGVALQINRQGGAALSNETKLGLGGWFRSGCPISVEELLGRLDEVAHGSFVGALRWVDYVSPESLRVVGSVRAGEVSLGGWTPGYTIGSSRLEFLSLALR